MLINMLTAMTPELYLLTDNEKIDVMIEYAKERAISLIEKEINGLNLSGVIMQSDLEAKFNTVCDNVNSAMQALFDNNENQYVKVELSWQTASSYSLTLDVKPGYSAPSLSLH